MEQGLIGLTLTTLTAAAGLCMGGLSTSEAKAPVLECLIGGQEGPELLIADPTNKSINTGKRIMQAEVTAQSITWKEDGTVRMIDRRTGAVLHRLPDESFFHIGQCRSSKRKF
jgi:hypothetical protein